MPAVPANLKKRFQSWDAQGRPQQAAFDWIKENWQRYLGDITVLNALPNPIDRGAVADTFKRIHDADTALDAFIASYLWGYAKAGFGPYRASRVIGLNTDPGPGRTSPRSCTRSRRLR